MNPSMSKSHHVHTATTKAPSRKLHRKYTQIVFALYMAAIMDLHTRKIVGWSMRDHLRAELATSALLMAIQRQRPSAGLIQHSDRGVQPGLNRSSQRHPEPIAVQRRAPRRASSSRVSSVACR